ncbi:MAG TPA: RHS repeat-associated core domain-containing protein [Terriglobales bacterium]|nr:RHS repeat-associated core domain-containing protein [Terriglobales bacterium]
MAELTFTGSASQEYAFFNGKRVARRAGVGNTVYYYFADHLGSTGEITLASGAIDQTTVYYPYGGEISVVGPSFSNNYKFTGKERDTESGLDNFGARYDASTLGRFMSPDPLGGHTEDPQTLNKYGYVRNSPTFLTDPTGLDSNLACQQNQDSCQQRAVGIDEHNQVKWANVQTETVDGKSEAIQIGSDGNGGLKDVNTGQAYTGSANGSGMSFSSDGGKTSSMGIFANGTPSNTFQDAGWANGGKLSGFTYTLNNKLEAGQTEAGTFNFSGTQDQAAAALRKAGHFNLYQINLNPSSSVPQVQGNMHFGEHNPFTGFGIIAHCASDGACQ